MQEETVAELRTVESEAASYLDQISRYEETALSGSAAGKSNLSGKVLQLCWGRLCLEKSWYCLSDLSPFS